MLGPCCRKTHYSNLEQRLADKWLPNFYIIKLKQYCVSINIPSSKGSTASQGIGWNLGWVGGEK